MADTIRTGTILIEEGTLLPETVRLESKPYSKGWRLVTDLDGRELDGRIRDAGWTFFYMAGELSVTGIGFGLRATTGRAVKRLVAQTKATHLSCLEIVGVAARRLLGITFVTVNAHARHIQKSMFLFREEFAAKGSSAELAEAGALRL